MVPVHDAPLPFNCHTFTISLPRPRHTPRVQFDSRFGPQTLPHSVLEEARYAFIATDPGAVRNRRRNGSTANRRGRSAGAHPAGSSGGLHVAPPVRLRGGLLRDLSAPARGPDGRPALRPRG